MVASLIFSEGHAQNFLTIESKVNYYFWFQSKQAFLSRYNIGWKGVTKAESLDNVNSAHFKCNKSLFLQLTLVTNPIKGYLLNKKCTLIITQPQKSVFNLNEITLVRKTMKLVCDRVSKKYLEIRESDGITDFIYCWSHQKNFNSTESSK